MDTDVRTAAAVAALRAIPADGRLASAELPYSRVLSDPERHLGPFRALPPYLRAHLVRLFREDEEVRTLAAGAVSSAAAAAGAALSRLLYGAERLVGRTAARASGAWRARYDRLRIRLRIVARRSAHLPFALRRGVRRVSARLQLRRGRCDLGAVLRAEGFDTRPLGFSYLEGIPQVPGCATVLRRAEMSCVLLIGLDFIRSGGVCWFLEGNCNPALMDARLALYTPGDDPWVNALLGCARARGFGRLVVYGYRPFAQGHAAALMAGGRRMGVEVVIVDDLFAARVRGHRRAWLIDERVAAGALVVRAKTFDVLFDRALLSKQQTRQIVEPFADTLQGAGVVLPRLLLPGSAVADYQPTSPYPTAVAKVDGLDRGAGVSFYKLPSVPPAGATAADYFEEYRVPDPCPFRIIAGKRLPLPHAARAWKVRSYALLTPEGVEYLSSIKVIAGKPIPPQLAEGVVAEKNIYLATINEGGMYSAVGVEEDETYRRAVAAVGGALLAWVSRKYATDAPVQPSLADKAAVR
jgi:hypothetical protein